MGEPDDGLTESQRELRAEFEAEMGYWSPAFDDVLRLDETFFEQYTDLLARPHRSGHLEPKVREFMLVAVNAVTTQLHEEGTRTHVRNAFAHGATFEEVREVLQRASGLGVHSVTEGVPVLVEAMGERPEPSPSESAERERLRAAFEERRGYWNDTWAEVLRMDPEFFEHYLDLSAHPYEHGPLPPKVKEFLSIAYDAAATNLFMPGLRGHVENALALGATPEEVMEVLELASIVGFHTLREGAPILIEEARRADALPEWWPGEES